jgi:phospholipid/cholesterol/gamma-HCH transport system permease protein
MSDFVELSNPPLMQTDSRGMTRWIGNLGAAVLESIGRFGRTGMFLGQTLVCGVAAPAKGKRVLRQIWFIGWKSMLVIVLTGTFTGMVVALQGFPTLRRVGSEALLGPMVSLSLIRELGPVLTALMVTGRAGSAIAAEIGIMHTSEQIDALELMGLNPLRYVVVPNVLASLVAVPVLTVVFDVIGIFGGYLVGVGLLGLNSGTYFGEMSNYVEMKDVLGGIYKAITFGLLIGWVSCYKGYYSRFGAEGVSAATTQTVVNTSVLILVWDYFVTSVVF